MMNEINEGLAKHTIGMFYIATEWGFLCADGRFELDLRRATNYESFSAANAQAKSYSQKGRMRFSYWAIVKPAVWENLRKDNANPLGESSCE